jgi:hypothetical protein
MSEKTKKSTNLAKKKKDAITRTKPPENADPMEIQPPENKENQPATKNRDIFRSWQTRREANHHARVANVSVDGVMVPPALVMAYVAKYHPDTYNMDAFAMKQTPPFSAAPDKTTTAGFSDAPIRSGKGYKWVEFACTTTIQANSIAMEGLQIPGVEFADGVTRVFPAQAFELEERNKTTYRLRGCGPFEDEYLRQAFQATLKEGAEKTMTNMPMVLEVTPLVIHVQTKAAEEPVAVKTADRLIRLTETAFLPNVLKLEGGWKILVEPAMECAGCSGTGHTPAGCAQLREKLLRRQLDLTAASVAAMDPEGDTSIHGEMATSDIEGDASMEEEVVEAELVTGKDHSTMEEGFGRESPNFSPILVPAMVVSRPVEKVPSPTDKGKKKAIPKEPQVPLGTGAKEEGEGEKDPKRMSKLGKRKAAESSVILNAPERVRVTKKGPRVRATKSRLRQSDAVQDDWMVGGGPTSQQVGIDPQPAQNPRATAAANAPDGGESVVSNAAAGILVVGRMPGPDGQVMQPIPPSLSSTTADSNAEGSGMSVGDSADAAMASMTAEVRTGSDEHGSHVVTT